MTSTIKTAPQVPTSSVVGGSQITPEAVVAAAQAADASSSGPTDSTAANQSTPLALDPKVLAKYERERNQALQIAKQHKDALLAKQAEIEQGFISKDRIKTDVLGVLSELGITYEQLTQAAVNQPSPEQQQINQLNQKIEAFKSEAQKAEETQYTQAVNQIRSDALRVVEKNPAYETIKAEKAHEAVVRLIEEQYKTDGTLLSVEEAADLVEGHLVEEAVRMASHPKIKARLAPPPPSAPPPENPAPEAAQTKPGTKTLTNAGTAGGSKTRLTAAERRARAIAAMQGTLEV